METIISHNKLQELLSSIDGWNLFDTVLVEFKECSARSFYFTGGVCEDSDGTQMFRTLIIDRETNDIYRTSFNADWCHDERKEWLWAVTARQQVDSIQQAKMAQKARTRMAWAKFCDAFA